jgi:hypothetical protein
VITISLQARRSIESTRRCSPLGTVIGMAVLLGAPLSAHAQQTIVRVPDEVAHEAVTGIPVDPATRVVVARPPAQIGRRALEALGLTREQLDTERAVTYSVTNLGDDAGRLAVFYASLLKQGQRWIFWSDDIPKAVVRPATEVQLTLDADREARYLIDFVLESGAQEFAVVVGDARTSQTLSDGHIAVVITGTGRAQTVRVVPLGDEQTHARHFTLFEVIVTPVR